MATKRQQELQDASKLEATNARIAAKEKKYQDSYMAFLNDKEKKEGQTFKNWEKAQDRKQKRLKEEEAQTKKQATEEVKLSKLKAQQITQDKKSRSLARDYSKFLKSNTGTLLEQLKVADADNNLAAAARGYARDASDKNLAGKKEENLAAQEAYNIAQEARKESMMLIDSGDFEGVDYVTDLQARLEGVKNLKPEIFDELKAGAKDFGGEVDGLIDAAGGGENFAKKMEMSKDSLNTMDSFKDKIFKVKSFLTDPKFRGMLLKGMFIGLAVKAAKALGDALKAGFDFAREMGISLKSMPISVGIAKDEAQALLDTFGTLEGVTNANLVAMKWNAYWYGVAGADSAKLMKLQMSITDSTKEMALEDQRDFMKELVKEGLSASKVFADMSGHSEFIAKYMRDGGENMKEAAKYAASMGLDLGIAESMADKLLDYESSIAAEMEASVLLGRSINLDKARQLAYSGKIKEMQEEVKRQVGGEAEFAKMNVVQREALGDAIGLNAVQLAEFVKAQDEQRQKEDTGWAKSALKWGLIGALGLGIITMLGAALMAAVTLGTAGAAAIPLVLKAGALGFGAGVVAGGLGGIAGGAAASLMAKGGPVKSGSPYIVGERGSELFVPTSAGSIIPHAAGGAGPAIDNSDITNRMDKQYEQNERLMKKLGSQFEFGNRQF